MKKLVKKGFSMFEILIGISIMSIMLTTALQSELLYTHEKVKSISETESFLNVAKDIEMSFNEDTELVKVSDFYITFKDNSSSCYFSYLYDKSTHSFEKVIDQNCSSPLPPYIRNLYKEKVFNVKFENLGNGSIKLEMNDFVERRSTPFVYYFSKPTYTLN